MVLGPLTWTARSAMNARAMLRTMPHASMRTTRMRVQPRWASSSAPKPPASEDEAQKATQAAASQEANTAASQAHETEAGNTATPLPRKGIQLDIDASSLVDAQALEAPEGEEGETGKRTNAKARSDRNGGPSDRTRNILMRGTLIGATLMGGYAVWMLGRDLDEREHEVFHDKEGVNSFFGRLWLRIQALREGVNKPVWDVLLPDPLPYPYSRPYTLVVDLDQLLVASSWSTSHGWRTAKRPGLDYFLGYLSQWYEIVLFTTQPFYIVEKVIEKLDPDRRYIAYQLFRESCRTHNGKLVKDISHLNRDLRKVIVLDINPEHVSMQPENAIVLEPWKGDKNDRDLLGLIPFLDAIGIYGVSDVRTTLKAYEGKHIPTEYAINEAQVKKRHEEEWLAKKERLGGLSGLFGGIMSGQASNKEPPKTFLEQERVRFQQGYLEDQKFWRENGEALRKQMQEEQERQLQEMKLNAWEGVTRIFTGAPPPPPSHEPPQGAAPATPASA
ncbi:mitochondrial inner membrane protein required for protein import [Malassezia pachydermatis]